MTKYLYRKILSGFLVLFACHCTFAQQKNKPCPDIRISLEVKHEFRDQKNGEIKLVVAGGKAPYTVQWMAYNFQEKGLHIKNLKAGYYSVIIIDSDKCVKKTDNIRVEGINQ